MVIPPVMPCDSHLERFGIVLSKLTAVMSGATGKFVQGAHCIVTLLFQCILLRSLSLLLSTLLLSQSMM